MPSNAQVLEKAKLLKAKLDEQKIIFDAQDARAAEAEKANGDINAAMLPTADEETKLKSLDKEITDLDKEVSQLNAYVDARAANESRTKSLTAPLSTPQFPGADPRNAQPERKSPGREFTESKDFKDWLNQIAPGGGIPAEKTRIDSPAVDLKALVLSSSTSGGAMVRRDYGPFVDLPLRTPNIRDMITVLRTGSNLIEYVRATALTRAAAIVPEATATTSTGYDNAAKPEAGLALEIVQAAVKTLAVWMPITRQIFDDVPQLQSMIDAFLNNDLELALEEEIVTGAGGASHFTGLENTTGLTPQAFDTDKLTVTRKARTKVRIVGRANPTGFLLNPYDWEALDLTKDAENRYYFGGPLSMGTKMLWGLPVIESEVVPQGTGYVGDLKQMVVWDRERPTTRITDSHSDFFTHNLLAVLTELRAAFGILRPAAIVKMDFIQGANS